MLRVLVVFGLNATLIFSLIIIIIIIIIPTDGVPCSKSARYYRDVAVDWLSSVFRPRQHSIGYMGDDFYRSKDPTNYIKVLKEKATKEKPENTNNKIHIYIHIKRIHTRI